MKLCECGCGTEIPFKPKHKYRQPRYLPGHHVKLHAAQGRPHRVYVPKPEEIPTGLCECGCGKQTERAKATYKNRRHFRGHPLPYLPGHAPDRLKRGEEHHLWRGGRFKHRTGYVYVYAPDHPHTNARGYVYEHRLVMESVIGRYLDPREVVHHKNEVKDDNRPENLELMEWGEHSAEHAPFRKYDPEKMRAAGRKGAAVRWGKPMPQ